MAHSHFLNLPASIGHSESMNLVQTFRAEVGSFKNEANLGRDIF
jgi:hypothetical protein